MQNHDDDYLLAMRAQLLRAVATVDALAAHDGQPPVELVRKLRAQLDGVANTTVKYADAFNYQPMLTAAGWPHYCRWAHADLMFTV